MTLLPDQDIYAATGRFLRGLGHDVAPASDMGLARAPDVKLLDAARE